ncbi:MAG: T9SS type A sorting domain-containing protein [Bacteroidales bacterium]|nr:T9SS type A sorting domain-containing protein [Bacteroidales bacterium]
MKRILTLCTLLLAFSLATSAQVSEQEFQALKALYNATDGDNWFNRTGWESINTTATKDDVTTVWAGIKEIEDGHITKISFRGVSNNLSGPLPPEIGNLVWLFELNLPGNHLSGVLPEEIGNLASLDNLDLGYNNLSGPLPASLSGLVNLRSIRISNNPLNCDFPSEILVGLSNIRRINLYSCGLTGTLGNVFASLTNLEGFDVKDNQIMGEIPASINTLTRLSEIHFDRNQLTGNLPSLEGSAATIYYLTFSGNQLSGPIPSSYGSFSKMQYFQVNGNQLSGSIPAGIFLLPNFKRLYIQENYFTFAGIEPVYNQINALSQKYYWTTKIFPVTQSSFVLNAGDALALNAAELSVHALGGNNNRYKWYCNNVEVYSGNSPVYTVPLAGAAHAGVYRFEVTNTVVTDITLKSETITVNIIGGNEAPSDIILSATSLDENITGTVATLSAVDPDATDVHTFSLASGNGTNDKNNGKFQIIDGNQLKMISSADYETTPSLYVLITVNDGNGGVFTKAVTIAVNNINEAPRYNDQTTSVSIDENAENGTTVCTLTAQDPEGAAVTYSITSGNDNGAFGINGNKLVVADNTKLNYDVKNQYSLVVSASDGTLSANATITVSLNKINQMPQVENQVFALDENSPEGTMVGSIVATDREGDPLTYNFLTGNELFAFKFNGNTIEVDNTEALDFELHPVFNLTINVSDGISNVQATVTINLNNVSENTDNDILTFSVPEMVGNAVINNASHTIAVNVSDVSLSSLVATFTISPDATSNPVSGTSLDFTTPQTIQVTSQSGATQDWVVTVTKQVSNTTFQNQNLNVYPNPAVSFLQINGLGEASLIRVFNSVGQQILLVNTTNENEQIDISQLKKGNYLLMVESEGKRSAHKFSKL